MPAPVASGWSGLAGRGLHPLEMRRLFTAHGESGRSRNSIEALKAMGGNPRRRVELSIHDQAISASTARAARTSREPSPPSIVARIGSSSARGSLCEPVSRQETREVGRGAQFEHPGFLATGDFDRPGGNRLRRASVGLRPLERDLAVEAMQIGEPKAFAGLLDKGEGFLQRRLSARHIARRQQGFGKMRYSMESASMLPDGMGVDRGAQRRDIFRRWLAHRVGASMIERRRSDANILHFFFGAKGDEFHAVAFARLEIAEQKL